MHAGRATVGHPVDVASGAMYSVYEDVSIPGEVDLTWNRTYHTALLRQPPTPLGQGWTSRYFATLNRHAEAFHFRTPDGALEVFEDPQGLVDQGGVVRKLGSFLELRRQGRAYVITHWDVETGTVVRYVFKPARRGEPWPLASIEDVTGQGLDLSYDGEGRLISIRQRLERRELHLDYSRQGRIQTVTLHKTGFPPQVLMRYEYDAHGRLSASFNALGAADRYVYDADGRMTREMTKDGGVFSFRYDDQGRCIYTAGLDGYDAKSLRYLDHVGWTEVTDSRGGVTRYERLPSGQVISEVDPLGGTEKTTYDEHGRIVAKTYPNGATVQHEYDEAGNLSKNIDPLGQETTYSYNEARLPVTIIDAAGNTWTRVYDAFNRLSIAEDPDSGRWTFSYDANGQVVLVTNPHGAIARRVYSPTGDLVEAIDWEGHSTRYVVDMQGRIVEETGPMGEVTRIRRDALGNVVEIVLPHGGRIQAAYDTGNNLTHLTDLEGHVTQFRYGPCERLLEKTNALGQTIAYRWGTEPGQLEAVVNEKGEEYRFVYDPLLRPIREVGFDGRVLECEYDAVGNCVASINGSDERVEYAYDLLGQLLERRLPDGTLHTFSYDPLGNLTSAVNPACEVSFVFNGVGHLLKEQQGPYTIEHAYDAAGYLTQTQTSLGLEARYQFGFNGRVARLELNQQHVLQFDYNARGEEISRLLPGGFSLSQQYDSVGRLLEQRVLEAQRPGSSLHPARATQIKRSYVYSPSVLREVQDARSGSVRYAYDPLEQVVHALRDQGPAERFAFDATGNLAHIQQGAEQKALAYAPGDRLQRCGQTSYVYDDNGRLVEKVEDDQGTRRVWRYTWDALDQLQAVHTPEGEEWTYTYDALGRRLTKEGPGTSIRYVWDLGAIIHQLDHGTPEATWVYDPLDDIPLCTLQNDDIYSVITDHLGTPHEIIDTEGRIVWSARYTTWGAAYDQQGDTVQCPIRFPGQWHDAESGLHYNRFRYYDPATGRFISQDPVGLIGGKNVYSYAPNPIQWIDPLGLMPQCPTKGRAKNKTINSGSDAPDGDGVYVFTDALGNRYVGMTNNFKVRMNKHLASGHLLPGTKVKFIPIKYGTNSKGNPRSEQGQRRVRRFFEQKELGVDSSGNVKKNPPSVKSSRSTAAVTQDKWDAHGKGQDFSDPYFD